MAKMDNIHSSSVSLSPHEKQRDSVSDIMLSMIIALVPSLIWSCVRLGMRSLLVTLTCILSCVLFEFLYQMALKRKTTVHDLSAVVTGMLIAYNMPVAVPVYIPIVGSFLAIVVVKQAFGGLGKNYLNPALSAVLFVSLIWKEQVDPNFIGSKLFVNVDNIESPDPLYRLKMGELPAEDFFDLFFGNTTGSIGAISIAMLIVGATYLFYKKVITWHIPVTYLGVSAILFYLMAEDGLELAFAIASLCSGSLVLSAVFMATDFTTTPMTQRGKIVYGIGCAVLTVLLRTYTGLTQDCAIAILVMNLLSRPIDFWVKPNFFGVFKEKVK